MDISIFVPPVGMKQLQMMREKAKQKESPGLPAALADAFPIPKTAPYDSRFPNQNQTRYCYQMFLDYHRCVKKRGEEYQPCQYFKNSYTSLCPEFWVEKWEEQLEAGAFPGRI